MPGLEELEEAWGAGIFAALQYLFRAHIRIINVSPSAGMKGIFSFEEAGMRHMAVKAALFFFLLWGAAGVLFLSQRVSARSIAAAEPRLQGASGTAPEMKIWREFVALLKSGKFPLDRIRPLVQGPGQAEILMGFLDQIGKQAHWEEWKREPELVKNGPVINFILPLTLGDQPRVSYCFMFVEDKGVWYFHHLEAIFIRLDKTPPPPTSNFPDTTEDQKAWDREESYWSKLISWRSLFIKDKGKQFFLDLMKDGPGYFVWATSRVPFLPAHKAFIVFLCWEQAHLRGLKDYGQGVWLDKLTDEEAVVRLTPIYFLLYQAASHLKPQISFEDYKEIFETIWQDRAKAAGWTLAIEYSEAKGSMECVFRFNRQPSL